MKFSTTLALIAVFAVGAPALAHRGGLNKSGCHNNRKTREYHCHRSSSYMKQRKETLNNERQLRASRPASSYVSIASCYDGDTCTTTAGEKIRLACIDTPELRGRRANPGPAKAARNYLRSYLQGKNIMVRRITNDRYGRTVGELFANGTNVQQQLVASGHAQIYWKYAHQCAWTR